MQHYSKSLFYCVYAFTYWYRSLLWFPIQLYLNSTLLYCTLTWPNTAPLHRMRRSNKPTISPHNTLPPQNIALLHQHITEFYRNKHLLCTNDTQPSRFEYYIFQMYFYIYKTSYYTFTEPYLTTQPHRNVTYDTLLHYTLPKQYVTTPYFTRTKRHMTILYHHKVNSTYLASAQLIPIVRNLCTLLYPLQHLIDC